MKTIFEVKELPLDQLAAIGIYHDKQLLLAPTQVQALLSGRRTDLISLQDLKGSEFSIERLDARLSLYKTPSGAIDLMIHPIYKQSRAHPLLTDQEMNELITGKSEFIAKKIAQEDGGATVINVEYDKLTRDFVGYDVSKVQAPDRINGMALSAAQKSAFSNGELLEMPDGTRLMHRATEPKGVLSDRKALVLSVLLDGGISYLLLRGIHSISEKIAQRSHNTAAFQSALSEMEGAKPVKQQDYPAAQMQFESAVKRAGR